MKISIDSSSEDYSTDSAVSLYDSDADDFLSDEEAVEALIRSLRDRWYTHFEDL